MDQARYWGNWNTHSASYHHVRRSSHEVLFLEGGALPFSPCNKFIYWRKWWKHNMTRCHQETKKEKRWHSMLYPLIPCLQLWRGNYSATEHVWVSFYNLLAIWYINKPYQCLQAWHGILPQSVSSYTRISTHFSYVASYYTKIYAQLVGNTLVSSSGTHM